MPYMPCNLQQRRAGVLLHPTSLPSGTLKDARRWLDFMSASDLTVWQMLPLGVPQADFSPYQCLSAFAANPALLDSRAPYDADNSHYQAFCRQEAHWLHDYALFRCIKTANREAAWFDWPEELKWRDPDALQQFASTYHDSLQAIKWKQFQLHHNWQKLRSDARDRGIHLFGDMPIFVAHDSADVWACPKRFMLDDEGKPAWVTGVPPDYFSENGQRWGNPHYDWDYHLQENFEWWLARLEHHFQWFDLVRIDHFLGLEAVWMIDAKEETAFNGHWQKVPGDALLAALKHRIDPLPLVAEDLGVITPEVRKLKEKYGLPGMAVLQFAFDAFEDNPHKPQNIVPNCVAYTGTHDNDTTLGWYQALPENTQQFVRDMLHMQPEDDLVDKMIETVLESKANLAIIPLQDFLKLGSEARMNTPGVANGNWRWKFQWEQLSADDLSPHIHDQIIRSKRKTSS
ncbi:4-alpha-glucanotransferase [Thiolapillus sp.]|uniref:4-alpha-glucanotransferase n=2 Tax=Thiolapillus sp. TaxID=2017437 RepID=UPI00260024CA|nr:4-alpha-glucanotransferase [Thiolapillus sp.]